MNKQIWELEDLPDYIKPIFIQRVRSQNKIDILKTSTNIRSSEVMDWNNTIEGFDFWNYVLNNKNFKLFSDRYCNIDNFSII